MEECLDEQGYEWIDTKDPLMLLPYEMASHIFNYIPPIYLLRECTLVCQHWREFLEDPIFWKRKLRRSGNYCTALEHTDNIQWKKLYFYAAYQPNLVKSFDEYDRLSLAPWTTSSDYWDLFKTNEYVIERHRSNYNGIRNEYWEVEMWLTDSDVDVIRENNGCMRNYVTSYGWCCRDQIIELAQFGFNNEVMDHIQPDISVSEWFCSRWDCASIYNIRVDLLDGSLKTLVYFEHSEKTAQWMGERLGWRKVEHTFTKYGLGVRYIRYADSGIDTQCYGGHYGSKMAGAWARILFTEGQQT